MSTPEVVAVQAGAGPLGAAVLRELVSDPDVVTRVVGPDSPDLAEVLAGASALLVLDVATSGRSDARRLLAAGRDAGVPSTVVVSSATVYGAWPANPVPLTELAPVRPHEGVASAVVCAEVERELAEWRRSGWEGSVAVLRPCLVVDPSAAKDLRRSRSGRLVSTSRPGGPPVQLLALGDLAAAVVVARSRGLDGIFNVGPDGWLEAGALEDLVGRSRSLLGARLPWRSAARQEAKALEPYMSGSWVVANDRMRAEGWAPTSSTEELVVELRSTRIFGSLSPRNRQELSLAAIGAVALGLVGAAVLVIRGRRRAR